MTTDMKITTNNHHRDILYWYQLTEKERKEHNYLDTEQKQDDATFFYYRGWCYYLNDFQRINPNFPTVMIKNWEGYLSDSYFSGIVIRYVDDCERIVVGMYTS